MSEKESIKLLKSGNYTPEQWNEHSLWRYVNYLKDAIPLKEAIKKK